MNLAYIVDEYPPFFRGGLGTYAMEITPKLVVNGEKPFVCSRNTGNDPVHDTWNEIPVYRPRIMNIHETLPLLAPLDVQAWAPADQNFFLETVLFNQLAADYLINHLVHEKSKSFDMVICHDWLAAVAGFLIKRNLDIPLVFHFHSTEQGRTQGGSYAVKMTEQMAAEKADTIITVSYAMKEDLTRIGYDPNKIEVVYNGVDASKYNPDHYTPEMIKAFRERIGVGENPMIFFVGRLTWVKGADELIQAMPQIIAAVPDVRLVILGVGEMGQQLHKQIESLGISGHVIMHNRYVSEQERLLYYASCDCAVFPSKYEPFGIVCTEAMSMAKPVVVGATGTNGFREQIISEGPDQCGYHVNPWDPADIATYLIALLKDQDQMIRFGQAGRRRVLETFTWDAVASQTTEVYRKTRQRYRSGTIQGQILGG